MSLMQRAVSGRLLNISGNAHLLLARCIMLVELIPVDLHVWLLLSVSATTGYMRESEVGGAFKPSNVTQLCVSPEGT